MTPSDGPPPSWPAPSGPAPTLTPVRLHEAARTHPLTVGLELAGLVTVGFGILVTTLQAGTAGATELWLAAAAIGVRVIGWWFRTYTVTEGEIVLDEGILQRRHRVVPFTRIQQVDLRQPLLPRLFGLAIVHVETAAESGGTAVSLRSLQLRDAEALRDHLLAEQRRVRGGQAAPARDPGSSWDAGRLAPPRHTLVRLAPDQLLVAGATGSAAIGATALVLVPAAAAAAGVASQREWGPVAALLLFAALSIACGAAITALAAVHRVVQSWGFELSAVGDDLHVAYGLLDRHQHTMPRHRVQHVQVVDNPVRRVLGTVSLQLHSAATPGRGDSQQSYLDIPLARRSDVARLLEATMASDRWRPPELASRPPAARRRAVVRRCALTGLLALAIAVAWWPAGSGVLPLAAIGIPWGLTAHQRAGAALQGSMLALASGVVVHHLHLVPANRLQSARTSASPLQRRVDLASLHLDVAGGRGRLAASAPGLMDLPVVAALHAMRTAPQSR